MKEKTDTINTKEENEDSKTQTPKHKDIIDYYYNDKLFDLDEIPPMMLDELSRFYHNRALINPDTILTYAVGTLNDMLKTTLIISPDRMQEVSDEITQKLQELIHTKQEETQENNTPITFTDQDMDYILSPLDPTERNDAKLAVGISMGIIQQVSEVIAQKHKLTKLYELNKIGNLYDSDEYPVDAIDRQAYRLLQQEIEKDKAVYEAIVELDKKYRDMDINDFTKILQNDKFDELYEKANTVYKAIKTEDDVKLDKNEVKNKVQIFCEEFLKQDEDPHYFAPYAGVSRDDFDSLLNSPTLQKFSFHPASEALLLSSVYAKTIEKNLSDIKLSNGQTFA